MNKKKLQAAIAPFPIKQSDKERFVNTITEMSSNGGGGVEYEYYKIEDFNKITEFGAQYLMVLSLLLTISNGFIVKAYSERSSCNILCDIYVGQAVSHAFTYETIELIKGLKILKNNDIKVNIDIGFNQYGQFVIPTTTLMYFSGKGNNALEQIIDVCGSIQESFKDLFVMDIIYQLFKPITKEEYESMIGQEVTL